MTSPLSLDLSCKWSKDSENYDLAMITGWRKHNMAVATNDGERIRQVEREVSELKGVYQHLATKADIADTKADIAEVKVDIAETKVDIAETKADIKADIAEIKGELRLLKWYMALITAAVVYPLLERIWT